MGLAKWLNPLITGLVFLVTSPHPGAPHQHNKDAALTQEVPSVSEAPSQEPRAKTRQILYYKTSSGSLRTDLSSTLLPSLSRRPSVLRPCLVATSHAHMVWPLCSSLASRAVLGVPACQGLTPESLGSSSPSRKPDVDCCPMVGAHILFWKSFCPF